MYPMLCRVRALLPSAKPLTLNLTRIRPDCGVGSARNLDHHDDAHSQNRHQEESPEKRPKGFKSLLIRRSLQRITSLSMVT
jgi:hypothetical protein